MREANKWIVLSPPFQTIASYGILHEPQKECGIYYFAGRAGPTARLRNIVQGQAM
jgi:hypothetical protein